METGGDFESTELQIALALQIVVCYTLIINKAYISKFLAVMAS